MNTIQSLLTDHLDIWTSTLLTKSTAGRGSNGKLEAYGIKKLRELILELAVRGKLVPQGEEWSDTCLGDLGDWAVGSGFTKSEQGKEGLEILFAKVSDMNLPDNTKYIVTTNHTITETTAKKLGVNVHAAGTVIFPKIGGAIATNKRRILTRSTAIDNNCLGITPKAGVSTDWLYLILSSINLTKYQAGTSVPALSQGVIAKIPALLPPLAEQHRIVAKVDELMALCDQLEQQQTHSIAAHQTLVASLLGTLTRDASQQEFSAAWARISSHFDTLFTTEASIDQLKQTILQLAVMGKLVPQDPNDEPASVLLKRIQVEKARLIAIGEIKREKPLTEISEEEKPFKLPQGWEWVRLGAISEANTGYAFKSTEYCSSGTFVMRVTNINPDGSIDVSDSKYIDSVSANTTYKAFQLKEGDVLLVMVGGTLGKIGIVGNKCLPAVLNQNMWKMLRFGNMDRDYFVYGLRLINATQLKVTSSTHGHLAQGEYLNKLFPLPPIAEQHRIVAKVDELMALCDTLKARLADSRAIQLHLADAIVEQAVC